MRIVVDGKPVAYQDGDSLLIAMLRSDTHPTDGGCYCCGGDCSHCLASVDGVSYIRTCQVAARPGMVVELDHRDGYPPLPKEDRIAPAVEARNLHCDVVVVGQGESGQAAAAAAESAGKSVIALETANGQEAVGIYAGPLVVARTDHGMLHIHAKDEVVVATGAAELQPAAPGSHLKGLMTARSAEIFSAAGLDLGRVVAVGPTPNGVNAKRVGGDIVRFEDDGNGSVAAVIMADDEGNETRYECDSVALGLGLHPRNALALMGNDLPVRAIGDATVDAFVPKCPKAGIACACSGVSFDDLDYTWDSGFREMELIKRSTLAGTGTCQGMGCIPYLRSFILEKGKELQPRFTARPVNRQLTIGEISAGAHHHAMANTALDAEHRKLGAHMERFGHWWRPWNYGNAIEEYWAVREAVSIMDVSTLGKMIVSGPDALELLERLYPTKVRTIRTGRSRYVLILDERGYVMDDGLISKESDTLYSLTFTSGGSSHSEMWVRDWASAWGLDVRIMNHTMTLGAINVTGPLTNRLLERVGLTDMPKYMRHTEAVVGGVPCKVFRLSFTGELSYELHHPADQSVKLWRSLMEAGQDLGIKPHGLEALMMLRLEKGHVIVGQDTDFDSTPRRIHHDWAVKLDKEFFIGRQAIIRTNKVELDKMLVGFEMDEDTGFEGAVMWHKDEFAGHVTSYTRSPALGKVIFMGWLYYRNGELPSEVTVNGAVARRVDLPFYDKEASRARA